MSDRGFTMLKFLKKNRWYHLMYVNNSHDKTNTNNGSWASLSFVLKHFSLNFCLGFFFLSF